MSTTKDYSAWVKFVKDNDIKCKKDTGYSLLEYAELSSWGANKIAHGDFIISCFPEEVDVWLMDNCDINFIVAPLKQNYRST